MKRICAIVLTAILFAACFNKDIETPRPFYFPTVKIIVQSSCISCHQPGGQGAPVFLNTDSLIISQAAAIKASVIDPVSPTNKRMPLGGHLSNADTAIIGHWFAKGGKATD